MQLITAAVAFGLESVVKNELLNLNIKPHEVRDGKITFFAKDADFARAAINLRAADRLYLHLTDFHAETFDELFDNIRAFNWIDLLSRDAKIIVSAKSVNSKLFSLRSIQSIGKKAIIEKMKNKYAVLPETGPEYRIEISITKDTADVTLDMTGALHKRGYREAAGAAPLKETLAAGIVLLSESGGRNIIDPFCGSGTILIEAAMIEANIAPNLRKIFPREEINKKAFEYARDEAREKQIKPAFSYTGFDIDGKVLKIARSNAESAGVDKFIHFQENDVRKLDIRRPYGAIITNPPYAVRLGENKEIQALYNDFGNIYKKMDRWNCSVLTAYPDFEKHFRFSAVKKRKLYNGGISCCLYNFKLQDNDKVYKQKPENS